MHNAGLIVLAWLAAPYISYGLQVFPYIGTNSNDRLVRFTEVFPPSFSYATLLFCCFLCYRPTCICICISSYDILFSIFPCCLHLLHLMQLEITIII